MSQAKAFERSSNSQHQENRNAALNADPDSSLDNNPAFNGAAIIDENGNEVPITEDMIQTACKALGNSWLFPRQGSHH